jgi:ATP-dependent DNA helicase PIF1
MLFTRRAEVDAINMNHFKKLTNPPRSFIIKTENTGKGQIDEFVEYAIKSLDSNAGYSAELVLAVGAQVMLLKNIPDTNLVNGSRGVVVGFERLPMVDKTEAKKDYLTEFPVVAFKNGERRVIDWHTWGLTEFPGIARKQVPLRLAYAVTIHKAQGATLDCALIDVGGNTFEYGQAYVALSRVKDLDGLYIHDIDVAAFRAHPKVLEFYRCPVPLQDC